MNRYSRIASTMEAALQAKTGWGRNEVMGLLQQTLNQVADEEVAYLMSQIARPMPSASPSVQPHSKLYYHDDCRDVPF